MICSGEPLAEVIPSASATTRSSIPNAFQPQTSALPCPRNASQATGNASAPVMISPQPAEYGNGPASRPSAARSRKNPPPRRQTFRPIRKGIGIPSSVLRTDGEIEAATAAATKGEAMTVPIIAGPIAFEPRNRFAAASAAASPVHRPAPTETARRCDGLIGIAPVSALMLTMIAATRTMVPMKSSMASLLMCNYTYLDQTGSVCGSVRLTPDSGNPKASALPGPQHRAACRYAPAPSTRKESCGAPRPGPDR